MAVGAKDEEVEADKALVAEGFGLRDKVEDRALVEHQPLHQTRGYPMGMCQDIYQDHRVSWRSWTSEC